MFSSRSLLGRPIPSRFGAEISQVSWVLGLACCFAFGSGILDRNFGGINGEATASCFVQ